MKKYFETLDSFRGICACIVALSHFNANSIIYGSNWLDRGSPYVDFFFVLSGFIIFANYQDKLVQGTKIRDFIWLRWACLYPLHFMVLLAFIAVDVVQLFINFGQTALYPPFSAPGETPWAIASMFLLIHSLGVTDTLALNGPSWSISVEFYTYILFALIIVYIKKFQALFIGIVSTLSALALYFLYGELYAKLDYGFLRCVYGFGFGALTWMVYKTYAPIIERKLSHYLKSSALELIGLVLVCIYIAKFSFDGASFAAPIIFAALILLFANESGAISKLLKAKLFVFIGTLSYSIYMIHLFISGKFFELGTRVLESKFGLNITITEGDTKLYGTNLLYGSLLELFYLAVVIIGSYISYKLIEEPCRNYAKKLLAKRRNKEQVK